MKSLTDIRNGTRIFLDTSILLYARWGISPACRALLKRCQGKAVQGVITPFTLADFCTSRMAQEAQAAGFTQEPTPLLDFAEDLADASEPPLPPGGLRFRSTLDLSRTPQIIRNLTIYADDTRALLSGELEIASVHPEDFLEALFLQKTHGLLTSHSLNVAIARRLGLNEIAAADPAFDSVQGLIVYHPQDFQATQ